MAAARGKGRGKGSDEENVQPPSAPAAVNEAAWVQKLTLVGKGFAPTMHNVQVILQHDVAWHHVLQFDDFAQRMVFVKPPPTHEYAPRVYTPTKKELAVDGDEATTSQLRRYTGREVTDEDVSRAAIWIERTWRIKVSSSVVLEAMTVVARAWTVHPVRQYLDSLVWDGVPRLGRPERAPGTLGPSDPGETAQRSWLSRYLGCDDITYTQSTGRMFLLSMAARVYIPGVQAQHMMILEGPQGLGKSRALRALADPWFSEDLPDTTSKDALQQLSGVWLLEVAEMDAIVKGGPNAAKKFISKAIDRYRPPYGRRTQDFPRQNVFCGTTNEGIYLKDTTGNRRYWPVMTREIDVDLLTAERDQLFAEVVLAFRAGEKWWPKQAEVEMLRQEQDDRVEQDAWYAPVAQWIMARPTFGVTVAGVLTALDIDKGQWDAAKERRAVRLLLQMGRIRVRRVFEGVMQPVFDAPEKVAADREPPPVAPPPPPEPQQGALFDDDEAWNFDE